MTVIGLIGISLMVQHGQRIQKNLDRVRRSHQNLGKVKLIEMIQMKSRIVLLKAVIANKKWFQW
jgi:hypothetical protein